MIPVTKQFSVRFITNHIFKAKYIFTEILRALLIAALPIFIITYLLISRAITAKRLAKNTNNKQFDQAVNDMQKEYKQRKKTNTLLRGTDNRIINKWMSFGGGFYGLMAFSTYIVIEAKEIFFFFLKLGSLQWSEILSGISIAMFVELLKNAIFNLVDAFLWFIYWPKQIYMLNGWLWLLAAYFGYLIGTRLGERFPINKPIKKVFKG